MRQAIRLFAMGSILLASAMVEAAEVTRAGMQGPVALVWGGSPPQAIRSAEGGSIRGVVEQRTMDGPVPDKRIIGVRYEDLVLQLGASLEPKFYDWINASLKGDAEPGNGAVLTWTSPSQPSNQCWRREFTAALSEITVPNLDRYSRDRCYLAVKLRPGHVKLSPDAAIPPKVELTSKGTWLASGFRLAIEGLDCTQVRRIESFTIKLPAAPGTTPPDGEALKVVSGPAEFPDLEITLGQRGYEGWRRWFEDFVVRAQDRRERNGEIIFYGADMRNVLGRVRLFNLGITGLEYQPAPAGAATASDAPTAGVPGGAVTAKLYCERMELLPGGTASTSTVTEMK